MPRLRLMLGLLMFLLLQPLAASAADRAPPVEGTDYEVIDGGAPLAPLDGRIEVVEVFRYQCRHCNEFQPRLAAWKGKLPRDVRFSYLPLPSGHDDAFALAFFASEQAGVLDRAHEAMYRAVHDSHELPRNPTTGELATFFDRAGLDATRLATLMEAPAIRQRIRAAWDFAARSQVDATPTLIVNGRYRVVHGSHEDRLRTVDFLVARERAAARRRSP